MKLQTTFLILTTLVAASFASSVANVMADFENIGTQASGLQNTIQTFRNTKNLFTNVINFSSLRTDGGKLVSAIDKATADVNALPSKPVAEADAHKTLATFQAIEPTIMDSLKLIVSEKSALTATPVPGISSLVKGDLVNLKNSVLKLEAALILSAPADIIPVVQAIKTSVNAAFDTAIAAYS